MEKILIRASNGQYLEKLEFKMKGMLPTINAIWTEDPDNAFVAFTQVEALQVCDALRKSFGKKLPGEIVPVIVDLEEVPGNE